MSDIYFLCYRSVATAAPASSELFRDIADILDIARVKNDETHLSGALLFAQGYFCQILEGQKGVVMALYEKLKNDPRHHDLKILSAGYRSSRSFSGWSMAYAGNIDSPSAEIEGILKSPEELPTTEAGQVIRDFMTQHVAKAHASE